jgi:antitoxin HicB
MRNKHRGSDFDSFLEEEGLLAEAEAVAAKRVLAYQFELAMKKKHLTKVSLAKKMGTSRSALDRLLDPTNASVTLQTLERAAMVLGKKLKISLA